MNEPSFVPISVHCAIPKSERKSITLHRMNDARKSTESAEEIDETLAANFRERLGERSVHALRQQMADRGITIGSGAIQAAKQGSRGVRLETLQKFADFFDCSVADFLRSPMSVEVPWPFKRLDPNAYALVSDDVRTAAEDMLISAAKRAQGESGSAMLAKKKPDRDAS